MSRRVRSIVCVVAGMSLAMSCGPLFAQQDDYQEDGTVTEVGPMGMLVTDAKNHRIWVEPNAMAKITVAGTAEPSFLKGGLYVRFEAKLDKQGNVKEDVTKLSVVVLSENVQPRLDADIGPGDDLKEMEKKGPVNYLVIGRLKSFKKGELQVNTPVKDVKAKLADKPEITVDVADLSLVGEGDKIEIKGKLRQAPGAGGDAATPGYVLADEIKVTLVKPLEGKRSAAGKKGSKKSADKKPAGKKPKKKPNKRSADDGFGNGTD